MMIEQQTYRVHVPYFATGAHSLSAHKGDRLIFKRRDPQFSGWLWCESSKGEMGWVPASWIGVKKRGLVLERDYSAVELSVDSGDELRIDWVESGWGWARAADGREGWVPMICLMACN